MKKIILLFSFVIVSFFSCTVVCGEEPIDQAKKKKEHSWLTRIVFSSFIESQKAQEEALQELRNSLKDLDNITTELKQANEHAREIDEKLVDINNTIKSITDKK